MWTSSKRFIYVRSVYILIVRGLDCMRQKQPPEVFLDILQYLHGNTCARVSFSIKLQA